MTTLVTGAAGFVGSAVARRLLDDGHDVRALVRPTSDLRNLENMPVEVVHGDRKGVSFFSMWRRTIGCGSRTRKPCTGTMSKGPVM